MPDVVVHHLEKNWLVLIEAVSSRGPVEPKRRNELIILFQNSTAGLVFVTTFLSRREMAKHLNAISWRTDVWVADAPSHMIHLTGNDFSVPADPYIRQDTLVLSSLVALLEGVNTWNGEVHALFSRK